MRTGILASLGILAVGAGALGIGLLGGEPGKPAEAAAPLRPVVLVGACPREPGPEPRQPCAEYICHDVEGSPQAKCKAWAVSRPDGCVSEATTYEVEDGRTLPACLASHAPGSDACQFPAQTWRDWSTAQTAWTAHTQGRGCKESVSMDGRCLCLTSQPPGQVDGEVSDASALPAQARKRLVVCPGKGKGNPEVRWEQDSGLPAAGCIVAARPMIDVSLDAETDLVTQLRAACAPCPVSGRAWGPCPHCLLTDGGCAEACPIQEGGP